MSTVANASVSTMEKFKGENADLLYCLDSVRSAVGSAISDLKYECECKLEKYEDMLSQARELIGKSGELRSKAENVLDRIHSQYVKLQRMADVVRNAESVYSSIDKTSSMAQNVDARLSSAIKILQDYLGLTL